MKIESKFNLFETVYITTDTEKKPRIITSIQIMPGDAIRYHVETGSSESWHYEQALSVDPVEHDFKKTVGFKNPKP